MHVLREIWSFGGCFNRGEKSEKLHVHSGAEPRCCPSLQPAAQLAEQHHFDHSTGVFLKKKKKNTFQPLLFEMSPNNTPLIPPGA